MKALPRLTLLALTCLVVAAPAGAAGQLQNVATFTTSTMQMRIATYTDGANRVALIGLMPLAPGARRSSIALELGEWQRLQALFPAARDLATSTRKVAGIISETGTDQQCVIIVHGGTSMLVTLVDPERGQALMYPVPPDQLPAIMAALEKARVYIASAN